METPVMTVRLETSHRIQLDKLAKRDGKTRSEVIRELIIQAIQINHNQVEINQPVINGK